MSHEQPLVGQELDPGLTRQARELILNLSDNLNRATASRRGFLKGSSAFVLGLFLLSGKTAQAAGATELTAKVADLETFQGGDATPHLFIQIQPDETIQIVCHLSEMGQQVWTAVAQVLIDELDAPWENVRIEQAEGHPHFGNQNTDGSRSIRYNFERLRWMGAAMRAMLEEAAAQTWKVPKKECKGALGHVTHVPSGKKLSYGALAERAREMKVPPRKAITLKKREEWRQINKPVKSLTTPSIIRGEGEFGQDVRVEGMVYAVIARPPQLFGKIKSVDDKRALEVPGVIRTVRLPDLEPPAAFKPLGGVAVIAKDTWAAIKGREALEITWEDGPNANYDSAAFEKTLMEEVRKPGTTRLKRGDVNAALDAATKRVKADYYMPHQAHSAMEPPAVMARWDGDRVTCRGCSQAPQSARRNVASVCGIPEDNVTLEVTWLGGGFGRKSKGDHFAEAALIAREVGAPVKVVWTREDATRHSYYHTVSAQHLEGALDDTGQCTAF
ncbi:MAG: molybdopterin cofactor-binding domain-containing protein, partial [Myxococcota bacterium]|nr:molybdopterin cofactor-binding domain-containing protein [Myxococcota bacterium]